MSAATLPCRARCFALAVALLALPAQAETGTADDAVVQVGRALFMTHWLPADAPGVARGLGPLFNADSCDSCHNGGNGVRGPQADGAVPEALVVQLQSSRSGAREGDPRYGHVFNPRSVGAVAAEGRVSVSYGHIYGYYYPEGERWQMRVPHYQLQDLAYGPLAPDTVIRPRLAPPLSGMGLLESASGTPESAHGAPSGRFGWQARMPTLRNQVVEALTRDMGLSTQERPQEDCTPAEADCMRAASSQGPEVSDAQVEALVAFLRTIEVPPAGVAPAAGAELFASIGCGACHVSQLPLRAEAGVPRAVRAYTDLRLHDLGVGMSDTTVSGQPVPTRWRTPPLWGIAQRLHSPAGTAFLHDGRAQTVEEAILWHAGEATRARRGFTNLIGRSRAALLRFVESL